MDLKINFIFALFFVLALVWASVQKNTIEMHWYYKFMISPLLDFDFGSLIVDSHGVLLGMSLATRKISTFITIGAVNEKQDNDWVW